MPATATKSKTQTAFFRVSAGAASIEKEAGIIRGVKLMEVNRDATFAGPDGKAMTVRITPQHISALLAHAGNRALPIHFGHDWHEAEVKKQPDADRVEMDARVGALKTFRRDESGNLVADAYLRGEKKDAILWGAEHNPEDIMFSAVFNYAPTDSQAMPLNFRAADIVPNGAAVTALFSESYPTQKSNMDIQELLAALDDPAVKAAVKAILKSHTGPEDDAAKASEDSAAAEMESAADVKPEDKKPEDDKKPALMRAMLRSERARNRREEAGQTALLETVKTTAKAESTALLGAGGFVRSTGSAAETKLAEANNFITAQMANGCPNQATAIARMGKDKPELYAVFRS